MKTKPQTIEQLSNFREFPFTVCALVENPTPAPGVKNLPVGAVLVINEAVIVANETTSTNGAYTEFYGGFVAFYKGEKFLLCDCPRWAFVDKVRFK